MSYYKPSNETRPGLPPDPKNIACLFIDVQNFTCHPKGAFFKALKVMPESIKRDVNTARSLIEQFITPIAHLLVCPDGKRFRRNAGRRKLK